MTSEELAAEMHKFGLTTFNRWAIDGAAMLLQQAEQIESLKAECETRKAYGDEQTEFAIKNANERDALKADAERYRWYVAQLESGKLDKLDEAFRNMERIEVVTKQMFDAAIDAMKG